MTNQETANELTLIAIDKMIGALNQIEVRISMYGTNEKILHDLKSLKNRIELLTFTLEKEKK